VDCGIRVGAGSLALPELRGEADTEDVAVMPTAVPGPPWIPGTFSRVERVNAAMQDTTLPLWSTAHARRAAVLQRAEARYAQIGESDRMTLRFAKP
jgi:predicted methyltransferase